MHERRQTQRMLGAILPGFPEWVILAQPDSEGRMYENEGQEVASEEGTTAETPATESPRTRATVGDLRRFLEVHADAETIEVSGGLLKVGDRPF